MMFDLQLAKKQVTLTIFIWTLTVLCDFLLETKHS